MWTIYSQEELKRRLFLAEKHLSHPTHLFGHLNIVSGQYPLINQYLRDLIYTTIVGLFLLFVVTSLSYLIFYVIFKDYFLPQKMNRQQYEQQIAFDIKWSLYNFIGQAPLITLIKFGYPYLSKVQYQYPQLHKLAFYLIIHIAIDQFLTYWAHRILHTPFMYKHFHHIHHTSKSVTPYSAYAFHPFDAFLQAIPVLASCYIIPIPLDIVLAHGLLTTFWTISIHDNMSMVPLKIILYSGCHTIHHFPWGQNYNYGKFTSVCDRLYSSYCDPQDVQSSSYGFQPPTKLKMIYNYINKAYQMIVPDLGKQKVYSQSKQYLNRYKKNSSYNMEAKNN